MVNLRHAGPSPQVATVAPDVGVACEGDENIWPQQLDHLHLHDCSPPQQLTTILAHHFTDIGDLHIKDRLNCTDTPVLLSGTQRHDLVGLRIAFVPSKAEDYSFHAIMGVSISKMFTSLIWGKKDIRILILGLVRENYSLLAVDEMLTLQPQDNAGKTTLLYRLKVGYHLDRRRPVLTTVDRRSSHDDTHHRIQCRVCSSLTVNHRLCD